MGVSVALVLAGALVSLVLYFSIKADADALTLHLNQAEAAVRAADLSQAKAELQHARRLVHRHLNRYSSADVVRFSGLQREVNLAADLGTVSLEEMLGQAVQMTAPAWETEFARRYRHRASIVESWLLPGNPDDGHTLAYPIRWKNEVGLIALDGENAARLARGIDAPLIVGGRLESFRPEDGPPGAGVTWVARFNPDSVLTAEQPSVVEWLRQRLPRRASGADIGAGRKPTPEVVRTARLRPWPLSITFEQVIDKQGPPDQVHRQWSASTCVEVWVYERREPFVVHFHGASGAQNTEPPEE